MERLVESSMSCKKVGPTTVNENGDFHGGDGDIEIAQSDATDIALMIKEDMKPSSFWNTYGGIGGSKAS